MINWTEAFIIDSLISVSPVSQVYINAADDFLARASTHQYSPLFLTGYVLLETVLDC